MESPKQEQALVSMVELKKLAGTKLPPSSALRDLILSEPGHLPSDEAAIKAALYAILLYHELK